MSEKGGRVLVCTHGAKASKSVEHVACIVCAFQRGRESVAAYFQANRQATRTSNRVRGLRQANRGLQTALFKAKHGTHRDRARKLEDIVRRALMASEEDGDLRKVTKILIEATSTVPD
jgi:hypothetical protein